MTMKEQLAFAGDVGTDLETNTVSESGFSLQNATISVSTLVMLAAAVVALWTMRWCFWRMYGAKKEVQRQRGQGQGVGSSVAGYGTL